MIYDNLSSTLWNTSFKFIIIHIHSVQISTGCFCSTTFTIYSTVSFWFDFLHKWSSEAVAQRCSVKKVFLQISQNSQENTCARVYFLIKLQACNFIEKETLAQMLCCEFCEISKNILSYKTPLVIASGS